KDFVPVLTRLSYDKEASVDNQFYTINVGIGRYSGGGMRLVPHAEPHADSFALTYAKKLPVYSVLLNSWRFYTGGIGQVKQVTTTYAKQVVVRSLNEELPIEVEADGEWLGNGPIRISLLPRALKFLCP
ncbi:MAG: hypothetical protein AAFU03_05185, partial [Bacteroidota bacterium]